MNTPREWKQLKVFSASFAQSIVIIFILLKLQNHICVSIIIVLTLPLSTELSRENIDKNWTMTNRIFCSLSTFRIIQAKLLFKCMQKGNL